MVIKAAVMSCLDQNVIKAAIQAPSRRQHSCLHQQSNKLHTMYEAYIVCTHISYILCTKAYIVCTCLYILCTMYPEMYLVFTSVHTMNRLVHSMYQTVHSMYGGVCDSYIVCKELYILCTTTGA